VAEAAIARARARARRGTRWQSPLDVTRRRRPSAYAAVSLWCRADVVAHVSFAVLVLVVRVAQPPWRSSWAVPQRVVASHGQGLVRGRARARVLSQPHDLRLAVCVSLTGFVVSAIRVILPPCTPSFSHVVQSKTRLTPSSSHAARLASRAHVQVRILCDNEHCQSEERSFGGGRP
jgi:hypothetical protein